MKRLGLELCSCGHLSAEHERGGARRCLVPRFHAQRPVVRGTGYPKCKCRSFLNSRLPSGVRAAEPEVRASAEDAVRSKAVTVPVQEALQRRLEVGRARAEALGELEAYLQAVRESDRLEKLVEAACG